MNKINLNKTHRLKQINILALEIQNTKIKKISELRHLAEEIRILSDDTILRSLNSALNNLKEDKDD